MQSYADEIDWLKQKVNENSASMLYARLADRYLEIKEVDRAIEFAEKGVLLHPHYATARFILAKCYFENNQFDEANKHLKEALTADPTFLGALDLQSELLKRLSDLEKVELNYNLMLSIDPFNDDIHQKLYDLQHGEAEPIVNFESDAEPDDFLESGITQPVEHTEQPDQVMDDVILESPLQDSEFESQFDFDEPSSDPIIDESFADVLPESEASQPETLENPFEDFDDQIKDFDESSIGDEVKDFKESSIDEPLKDFDESTFDEQVDELDKQSPNVHADDVAEHPVYDQKVDILFLYICFDQSRIDRR